MFIISTVCVCGSLEGMAILCISQYSDFISKVSLPWFSFKKRVLKFNTCIFHVQKKIYKLLWKLNLHHLGKKTVSIKRKRQRLCACHGLRLCQGSADKTLRMDLLQPGSHHSPWSSVKSCPSQELQVFSFCFCFLPWLLCANFSEVQQPFYWSRVCRNLSGEHFSCSNKEEHN